MEKIQFKDTLAWKEIMNSKEAVQGVKDFHEHKLKNEGVKAGWHSTSVSQKEWDTYYSKVPGYVYLSGDRGTVRVGYIAADGMTVGVPITEVGDLMKVHAHDDKHQHE